MLPLTPDDYERYSRHLILPEVGVEGQRRLNPPKCCALVQWARFSPAVVPSGGRYWQIGIVDFDVVDRSSARSIHGTSW